MTITYYRIRVYVGPVHVASYAADARRAGLADVWQGTEHIYGTYAGAPCENETDRLCLRQRVGELIYPGQAVAWRDVSIID